MRIWVIGASLLIGLFCLPAGETKAQQPQAVKPGTPVTPQLVRDALDRGVRYLKSKQSPTGTWPEYNDQLGGVTALATLAMLEAGVPVEDPAIQKALRALRAQSGALQPKRTYALALQTMVFCLAEPERDLALIKANAATLQAFQVKGGERSGMWTYGPGEDRAAGGDNSNTQFALLALDEAAEQGAEVSEQVWRRSHDHWENSQNASGSWGYLPQLPGTGSMTSAGITSMIITTRRLSDGDAKINGDDVQCCQGEAPNQSLRKAYSWMDRNMSLRTNPAEGRGSSMHLLYYLYGIERVGRLSGQRFIGEKDWYREAAEQLVTWQDSLEGTWKGTGVVEERNPNVSTALALLFLSKGRRPVAISKLKYGTGNQWNPHSHDLANLVRTTEHAWKQRMTWQTIDVAAVTSTEELLQTPVLWISGKSDLQLTARQEEMLREYIEQGGFIFAEASCGGEKFDRDFRALAAKLFPESQLRLLPPDHPVWYAEQPVDPAHAPPLWGLDACCRTSIVYTPHDLSCYWELNRTRQFLTDASVSQTVRDKVKSMTTVGMNVMAYATGRQLRDKLEVVEVDLDHGVRDSLSRNVLEIPKLQHSGGSDDAPAALANMVKVAGEQLNLRFESKTKMIAAGSAELYQHPVLFMHGRRDFRLSQNHRTELATYLNRGGFLFADSICAAPEFTAAFRREMALMFPDAQLKEIPLDHPLYSESFGGFDTTTVEMNDPQARGEGEGLSTVRRSVSPTLEGLWIEDRLAVVFSPYDLSCAMESGTALQCRGYTKQDAARIATNIILYAMHQ